MGSKSETGHAKNVDNFEDVITYCDGYGSQYDPTKAALKLPALNTQLSDAQNGLSLVNSALPPWINAVNARELAFEPLNKLTTRVINALDACDVDNLIVKDARALVRKIQGKRAKPKKKDDPSTPEDESLESISASQMSFDMRIENFAKLIDLLKAQPPYVPNETDLTVVSLSALLVILRKKNKDVTTALTSLSNARIARDTVLYKVDKGLIYIAADVKKYVKSVFGGTSAEYKQMSKLEFKKPSKIFI